MSKRPDVYSPEGLCAAIGRKKYGPAMMARMAKAGRAVPAGNPVKAPALSAAIADATRNKYYENLSSGIDDIERAIAPMRLDWKGTYLEPAPADRGSRLYWIPILHYDGTPSTFSLALSYYRMPSGNYEITAYVNQYKTRGKGKRNPAVDPDSPEYKRTLERIYGKPASKPPSVHTRSPKEALEYEVLRRRGEKVGKYNPMSTFHEIGHYPGGVYSRIRLLPPRTLDSDAWMMAKEAASEVGHPVVLIGRGAPVTVAPAGLRAYNPLPEGHKFSTTEPVRVNEKLETVGTKEGYIAIAAPVSGNGKTGPVATTSVCQVSCPETCPFFTPWNKRTAGGHGREGCYGELGRQAMSITVIANKTGLAAGVSPELVAKAEAKAIELMLAGPLRGKRKPMRLHVVGDAKTDAAARTLAKACEGWADVWTYTHAWKNVSRDSWGSISVLASCETPDEVRQAEDKGYATAIVIPTGFKDRVKPFEWNGIKLQPCWEQSGHKANCMNCKLCWRDKGLLSKGVTIAFTAHSEKANVAKEHVVEKLRSAGWDPDGGGKLQ